MPITINPTTMSQISVPVIREIYNSHQMTTDLLTGTMTYQVQIHWSDLNTFIQEINGIFVSTSSSGLSTTTYQLPMECPYFPVFLLKSSSTKGIGPMPKASCATPYKYALVTMTFGTIPYQTTGPETMLTVEYDTAGSIVTCPSQLFSFVADGTPVPTSVGILVPETTINITRHRVPNINTTIYESCVGKMSSAVFFGRAASTVLCMPIKSVSTTDLGNSTINDVTYSFAWRAIPWDQVMNKNGVWSQITPSPYSATDLNVLFS